MGKTLTEELYGALGDKAQLNPEQFHAPTATMPVDRRSPESVSRELKILRGNALSNELAMKEAERNVNELTGAHAACTKLIAALQKAGNNPRAASALQGARKKLATIEENLNSVKATLTTQKKIFDSRAQQVADFLECRPFAGAKTNAELLAEDAELSQLIAEVERLDISVSQPSVGASAQKRID